MLDGKRAPNAEQSGEKEARDSHDRAMEKKMEILRSGPLKLTVLSMDGRWALHFVDDENLEVDQDLKEWIGDWDEFVGPSEWSDYVVVSSNVNPTTNAVKKSELEEGGDWELTASQDNTVLGIEDYIAELKKWQESLKDRE